ncbi:MAG: putative Rossmann-fold nucleotide-binding protein [Verrucomicrobiales bacterium]|jgi:predicted Rossmann-fold nucleotide-binding protein
MEVIIENSDAFVAYPGGAGTVQEILALLLLKQNKNPIMANKPVVLFDRKDEATRKRFWAPFIDLHRSSSKDLSF